VSTPERNSVSTRLLAPFIAFLSSVLEVSFAVFLFMSIQA